MPIFEYECTQCLVKFEELIRNQSEEETLSCPQCKSAKVEKQMSMFGFSSHSGNGSESRGSSSSSCSSCASKNCASCH